MTRFHTINSYRVGYGTRYSLCLIKGIRHYFPDDVARAVYVGINSAPT